MNKNIHISAEQAKKGDEEVRKYFASQRCQQCQSIMVGYSDIKKQDAEISAKLKEGFDFLESVSIPGGEIILRFAK